MEKGPRILASKKIRDGCPYIIQIKVFFRPFERTITLHKDSSGHVGFNYKDNKITAIAKETSAARNGLLIDHYILEANGQNVIGLKVCRNLGNYTG